MLSGSSPDNKMSAEELLQQFSSGSLRQRRRLVNSIESRSEELAALGSNVLDSFDKEGDDWAAGWILQVFCRKQKEALRQMLGANNFGWFNAPSSVGIDYGCLQENLLAERFEEADRLTSAALRELAGPRAQSRGYVYFSEVSSIPGLDLMTLDRLWTAFSQGKFGFSRQAELLSSLDGRYELLWPKIGWKHDGVWTRYPASFTWALSAPDGHMPLVNQLRGVRLMDAILHHPALVERRPKKN